MRTKLSDRELPVYTKGEERFNMISHIVGGAVGIAALVLCIAFYLDGQRAFRFKNKPVEQVLAGQKPAVKWLLYYALVVCILAGFIIQNGGFGGGASFAYANF